MNASQTQSIAFESDSLEATLMLGRTLAAALDAGDVIALSGELGAGKTQLVRGIAAGLGADERSVSSPTFVLMAEYPIDEVPAHLGSRVDPPTAIVHVDAYRMTGLADLESIGFEEELFRGAVTLIEWADRIGDDMPDDHLRIEIDHAGENSRSIRIEAAGGHDAKGRWGDRLSLIRRMVHEISQPGTCPTCKEPTSRTGESFPFCTERCRLVDLGRWFRGDYKLTRPVEADEELED